MERIGFQGGGFGGGDYHGGAGPVTRTLEDKIAKATRQVKEGRLIVQEQQRRILEGTAVPGAADLLESFEGSLKIFEAALERLLEQRSAR